MRKSWIWCSLNLTPKEFTGRLDVGSEGKQSQRLIPCFFAWEDAEGGRNEEFYFHLSLKSLLDIQAEILNMH